LLPDLKMLTARAHDAVRNDPVVSGGVQTQLDNIIGSGLRLSVQPDWRALGLSAEWASEWARIVEPKWRLYANDIDCGIDASLRLPFSGLIGLGTRSFLSAGEITASSEWIRRRNSRYRSAIQMFDPARLSNPNDTMDTDRLRAGVELGRFGQPIAYHIRQALQSDAYMGSNPYTWQRVSRETSWGRRQILHVFEPDRPGQTRGKTGIASILAQSKLFDRFRGLSLEAATINAMYAAIIESEFDHAQVAEALGGDQEATEIADKMLAAQADYHSADTVRIDGVKVPHLYPGEKLRMISSEHPGPNFAEFEASWIGHMAAGLGISREQLSRDYSKTNFAGARMALNEAWKFFMGRRHFISSMFASQIYALWLEEAIDIGEVPIPPDAPDFYEAKTAWCGCRWIGPGKGKANPLQDSKADALDMDRGVLTLEDACAERGVDWEENLEQIAREKARMKELGIEPTDLGQVLGATANDATGTAPA
jgi:lambda family phage portal protein